VTACKAPETWRRAIIWYIKKDQDFHFATVPVSCLFFGSKAADRYAKKTDILAKQI
jgi:hypothetical protein